VDKMEFTTPLVIAVGTNIVIWLIQFVALKTDTKWIKERLKSGDKRLGEHEKRLNAHQARISSLQTGCSARHPGTIFPSVSNGVGESHE